MSGMDGGSAAERRLRTSVIAITAAVLLFFSVQCIVNALEAPLQVGVGRLINFVIKQRHLDVLGVPDRGVTWTVVLLNLLIGTVALFVTYSVARWNYNRAEAP